MLRAEADGVVVVTIAEDKTLALYPVYEWNRYVAYLERLGRSLEVSKFRTRVTSMAKSSTLDGQNRLTLTQELLQYAGIDNEVTFAADGNRVRMWNPVRFTENFETVTPNEEDALEKMFYLNDPGIHG